MVKRRFLRIRETSRIDGIMDRKMRIELAEERVVKAIDLHGRLAPAPTHT